MTKWTGTECRATVTNEATMSKVIGPVPVSLDITSTPFPLLLLLLPSSYTLGVSVCEHLLVKLISTRGPEAFDYSICQVWGLLMKCIAPAKVTGNR